MLVGPMPITPSRMRVVVMATQISLLVLDAKTLYLLPASTCIEAVVHYSSELRKRQLLAA